MTATETSKTERIVLSDGRRGTQTRELDQRGHWTLTGIVIDQQADRQCCHHVYARRRYLDAHVYEFADLGNVTWQIED